MHERQHLHSPIVLTGREHALEEGAGILVVHEVMQTADVVIRQQCLSQSVQQVRVSGFRGGCQFPWQQPNFAGQSTALGLLHCTAYLFHIV